MANTRVCSACGARKNNTEFGRRGKSLNRRCKICIRKYLRTRAKTVDGKVTNAWRNITLRATNRDGQNPTYAAVELRMTREEFVTWATAAYANWMAKGNSIESGSVDRIEDCGHYEIGNLQIISRVANHRKQSRNKNVHAPAGYAWCPGCSQYKLKNEFYPDKSSWTGVSCRCKICQNRYQRDYYRRRSVK